MDSSPKVKICFVCPYCYPLFNSTNKTMFGGLEVRISQIAQEVAKRGNFHVTVVVANHGQPHREVIDKIELLSWIGKEFSGIVIQPNKKPKTNNSDEEIINQSKSANLVSKHKSSIAPILAFINSIKKGYKKIIPWRIRILVSLFLRSLFRAFQDVLFTLGFAVRVAFKAEGDIEDVPVFPETIATLDEVNADVYIAPGNTDVSAYVAFFCKQRQKKYIMLAGSTNDFDPKFLQNPHGMDVYGTSYLFKKYTIERADLHIVQHEQQAQLAQHFGVTPLIIHNPIDLERKYEKSQNPTKILWVGNTNERVKQPSVMLEIIRLFPDCNFVMIVTPSSREGIASFEERAKNLSNLEVRSLVPFTEIEKYFAESQLFINTSAFEGFPNTFLQAGKYGIPIVSLTVDPNKMITEHGCGLLSNNSIPLLIENIKKALSDKDLYHTLSENILDYVHKYHDKEIIIPQYEEAFRSVLKQ